LLKLSSEYEALIEKVSKNLVTKSKCCVAIAVELRALNIQLCKRINIEENKDFVFSTFLDQSFGIKSFDADLKVKVN